MTKVEISLFINPLNHEIAEVFFPTFFEKKLENLCLRHLFFFRQFLTFLRTSQASVCDIKLNNFLVKTHLFTTTFGFFEVIFEKQFLLICQVLQIVQKCETDFLEN